LRVPGSVLLPLALAACSDAPTPYGAPISGSVAASPRAFVAEPCVQYRDTLCVAYHGAPDVEVPASQIALFTDTMSTKTGVSHVKIPACDDHKMDARMCAFILQGRVVTLVVDTKSDGGGWREVGRQTWFVSRFGSRLNWGSLP
jgi:hypothetical protein